MPVLRTSLAVCALIATHAAVAQAPKLKASMEVGVEGRLFFENAAYPEQHGSGLSVSVMPELDYAVGRGSARFVPFARWDQFDDERSHLDIRELNIRQRWGNFDVVAGIDRVFWGTTESVHLVDIINQTDGVENVDGEDKLGQPLLSVAWTGPAGVFTGYVLPGFRERTLPGAEGRLRAPIPYALDDARFESSRKKDRLDAALRWNLYVGALDLGISHFSGTAREPRFEGDVIEGESRLVPVYDLIEQTGVDLSLVQGGMVWKLEAIYQDNRIQPFTAAAAGFEYTFASVRGSSWDVGVLAEGLWDERGRDAPSPFQKDLFLGSRLAANDIAGTELLAGVVLDLDHAGAFASLEASRRIGNRATLNLELRLFESSDLNDPLRPLRRDDYLQLELIQYF